MVLETLQGKIRIDTTKLRMTRQSENDFVQPLKKFNLLVITIIAQIEPRIKDRGAGFHSQQRNELFPYPGLLPNSRGGPRGSW